MSDAKVQRDHHPNGQLRWEATIKNGKPVGIVRFWYDNGVLKEECPHDDDGLEHGIVKKWNKEGKLLGAFRMDHGTGLLKSWYENGQLESEIYYVRGKCCGRFRMWWEDGSLMSETYELWGRKVSKKKYMEACKTDPALPRYEDDDLKEAEPEFSGKYQKHKENIYAGISC